MMKNSGKWGLAILLICVMGTPLLLKPKGDTLRQGEDRVVIITPHAESIRYEFGHAFQEWYHERTGRRVAVDYRVIGGTSEISKFIRSEYTNSFRNYWTGELGRSWGREVQEAFANHRIELGDNPEEDTVPESARRAFLTSNVGCGIDLFFGGGTYDFRVQARAGNLVDAGLLELHPDWFGGAAPAGILPEAIPLRFAGERFYDEQGRWFGVVLSSYGIIYNRELLDHLGVSSEPRDWSDLAGEAYFRQVAVCDPTKSGSMTQAFEMILQQQMQLRLRELESISISDEEREYRAVREGWDRGMVIIQRIAANARYFTDSSQKPNIDVAMGDCAAGMSIDFYGRFQQENILKRSGDERFGFWSPQGGSTISADPIGLLRGAPNPQVAVLFMEFVLSIEGQKLWNFEVGAPGGPRRFALRRPPIRPELYSDEWNHFRSDADFIPYVAAEDFHYRSEWTGPLFSELRNLIRMCFIDVRPELVRGWSAILKARAAGRTEDAAEAEKLWSDLSRISYDEAATTIDRALKGPAINEVRLGRELGEHFRRQYLAAEKIANGLE